MAKSNSYKKGYSVGRCWSYDWVPGGPWSCDAESRKANAEWLEGWHVGVKSSKYKDSHPKVAALIARLSDD